MESGSMARMLLLMIRLKRSKKSVLALIRMMSERSKKSVLALIRMMSVTFDLFIWLFACEFVCKGKKKLRVEG